MDALQNAPRLQLRCQLDEKLWLWTSCPSCPIAVSSQSILKSAIGRRMSSHFGVELCSCKAREFSLWATEAHHPPLSDVLTSCCFWLFLFVVHLIIFLPSLLIFTIYCYFYFFEIFVGYNPGKPTAVQESIRHSEMVVLVFVVHLIIFFPFLLTVNIHYSFSFSHLSLDTIRAVLFILFIRYFLVPFFLICWHLLLIVLVIDVNVYIW